MGPKLSFLFGVHLHQPVGNFGFVLERLARTCYGPLLKIMSEHPGFRFSFHASGHLLQWLEENQPEIVDLLAGMVQRRQVEVLAGGFYEPILAAIPRRDRRGQLRMCQRYLRRRFGVAPLGIWLTERVWESEIVEDLTALGFRYVVVDDRHLRVSGFGAEEVHSYYVTEAEGRTLALFPIDEKLRYMIPFRPVEELVRYLEELRERNHPAAIYMDDGEKFGGWPGTREWVYEKKWLHRFLDQVETLQGTFLETALFSDLMIRVPPRGICYLPNASYSELEEWALPAAYGVKLKELKERLSDEGERIYLRGGHWKNFLVKYPEANRMHKKMLILSAMVERRGKRKGRDIVDALYRAQCNDAYWHGVFGGLYLPHLRQAVWRNLAEVEKGLREGEGLEIEARDVDLDGRAELWSHSRHFSAVWKPSYGGQLKEYLLFSTGVNYLNTLSRRFEAYHTKVQPDQWKEEARDGVASIHDLSRKVREPFTLAYDPMERGCFIDHFFLQPLTLEEFKQSNFTELGDFCTQPFTFGAEKTKITMRRAGKVRSPDNTMRPVDLVKRFRFSPQGAIKARYSLLNPGPEALEVGFGMEFNLSLPAMNAGGGEIKAGGQRIPLGGQGSMTEVEKVFLSDWFSPSQIELRWSLPAALFFYPVQTLSRSEGGFDTITQQVCLMPYWSISVKSHSSWDLDVVWTIAKGVHAASRGS